jgi:type I restriction enzyme R subunit
MSAGPEYTKVERPFLDQLAGMGWNIVTGNIDFPSVTGRASFREVILAGDLRQALRRINLRDGEPWLDDGRISQAVSALERIGGKRLMEANQEATRLLHEGIEVEGVPGWDQGRSRMVRYIDWDHPGNNTFTAINQFRVDCPGGLAKAFIAPDIVLFVNGIPLVVIECKSPDIPEPIPCAVDQLRRYTNQRKAAGEIDDDEGNERLFFTNQFLVASSFDEARAGTIGADLEHYLEWKDTAPVPLAEVQAALGVTALSSQHRLIAGMLRPAHLLDIVRHFTLYQQGGGRTIKIVCRYQQFRAVQAAIHRLRHGATQAQDGMHDRRGGIVWHTQGSGKSLTMVFLVRKMRSLPALQRFKIVVVTDRKDLQDQLSDTAALTGETVRVGKRVAEVKKLLAQKGPGLVFAMIQKYRERGDGADLGVLNEDESILVLVDEAHRSHASALHAHLLAALPGCARIGFTGTPILMGARKRTHDIFGAFIDRYTIRESEADGATVPILYEGRTAEGAVSDGRDLDQLFEDMFAEKSPEELERIKQKYATKGKVLESKKLIAAKARDMLAHYVQHILPSGLKAQVVACSRRAAVRYGDALRQARDELVEEARALDEDTRALDDVALARKPRKVRAAVHAWRQLAVVEALEVAPVISTGDNNDDPAYREWTDAAKIKARIQRFKKPLHGKPGESDPLAFLVVKSMLLTGFDAPIEGVMYLDRPIQEAELLQAIARVNRTGHRKNAGLIIDYYGVARHLKEALSAYSAEDIEGALQDLAEEIPRLRDRHQRVIDLLREHGADPHDVDACVDLLEDERVRASFAVRLKQFLATLDVVFPRPEALPYLADAERFGLIYEKVRLRVRGEVPPLARSVGRKVARLIDEHVIALGIDPLIPPISITDAEFTEHVNRQASPRARASEMKHALRHHIRKHLQEDPVHYQKLSERLEQILATFGDNWEQLSLALQSFVVEVQRGRQKQDDVDLDPATQAPFCDLLVAARAGAGTVAAAERAWLAGLTVELVAYIRREIAIVGFWKNANAQEVLRGAIFEFLDEHGIVDFERADAVSDELMELARANHHKLVAS